eukprot:m.101712 g.101712  ORF g.101712 m.101712 type:complete len:159 (-) comp12515_c0_seq6:73-549(-)
MAGQARSFAWDSTFRFKRAAFRVTVPHPPEAHVPIRASGTDDSVNDAGRAIPAPDSTPEVPSKKRAASTENNDQHLHKRSRQELLSFREGAIIYLFEACLDYPDPSEDAETVENIRLRLSIPRDHAYIIKTVIDKCRDRASNPKSTKASRGRPKRSKK